MMQLHVDNVLDSVKIIFLVVAVGMLIGIVSGCSSDQIVIESGKSTTADQMLQGSDTQDVEVQKAEIVSEPVVRDVEQGDEVVEDDLIITEGLVTWGHAQDTRAKNEIDAVIIHSVYNPFEGETHGLDEVLEIFEEYDVAPHYIIMRDGEIVQTVKEQNTAWHAGRSRVPDGRTSVNDFSIGIEMVNSIDDVYTKEQYASLRALVEDIDARYDITYVLGHDEIKVEDPWNFDWESINDLRHESRTE